MKLFKWRVHLSDIPQKLINRGILKYMFHYPPQEDANNDEYLFLDAFDVAKEIEMTSSMACKELSHKRL